MLRKMRSFRFPLNTRIKLQQLHFKTGKNHTDLLIEAVDLLSERYELKFPSNHKKEKEEEAS